MARNPDHYAIVIGIDSYSSLRRLKASGADATRFAAWLKADEGGGLCDKNIAMVLSPATLPANRIDAMPVRDDIDNALIDFGVLRGERLGTRLYFYFAGHAFGPKFNEVCMLMVNASPQLLNRNIGLNQYRDYFHEKAPFDEVVYILTAAGIATAPVSRSNPACRPACR